MKGIQTKDGVVVFDYKYLENLPVPDTTLSKSGEAADAAIVGTKIKELEDKVENPPLRWKTL